MSGLDLGTKCDLCLNCLCFPLFQPLEGVEEGSWLNRYPETVIEFLTYLYRNVGEFGAVCTSQDFLENLVGILFPKRRGCSVPPQDVCEMPYVQPAVAATVARLVAAAALGVELVSTVIVIEK